MRTDIPVADRPSSVVVGDFNGDSRPDLAVNSFSGFHILLNTGRGAFARRVSVPAEIHPMFGPTPTNYTIAADFDLDGRLDLVGAVDAANPPLRRSARLLLGQGDGTFVTREIESGQLEIVGVGDFNGDRIPDLAFRQESSVTVQLGNGAGYFQRGARIQSAGTAVALADINNDGLSDIVTAPRIDTLAVMLNNGDGTFRPPVETAGAAMGVIADFNRDGVPDIASPTEVLLGRGDGTFRPIRYIPSRRGFPVPFAAADFDGDGHVDLAGWLYNEGGEAFYVSVFRGNSDGTLSPPVDYVTGSQATGQGVADLDADGRPDLIVANFRLNTVTLLMPRTPVPGLNRAVSAASGTAVVAPGSLATVYASTAGAASQISLEVRDSAGVARPAPLLFVSPTQINFEVPSETALGEAALIVTDARGPSTVGSMQVAAVAPGLFMVSHANATPAATAVRVSADGRQTPVPVFNCFGPPGLSFSCGPAPIRPAGDPIYLTFFGTGFRNATSANVTASVNGLSLPVEYAGPQGTPGVDQINVRLLPEAASPAFFTLAIDGVVANTALLALTR